MLELGVTPSATAIVEHYGGLLSGLVVDHEDEAEAARLTTRLPTLATAAVMQSDEDRVRLARAALDFARGPALAQRRAS
jgi:LPPG:FO 2-phospho-L-lactate transferase